jgi:hypothetical protein
VLPLILELSSQPRSNEPLDARGIARQHCVLLDGGDPRYTRIHTQALKVALREVDECLTAFH